MKKVISIVMCLAVCLSMALGIDKVLAGTPAEEKWSEFTTRYKNKMDGYNSNPELGLSTTYEVQIAGNDLTVRAVSKSDASTNASFEFNYDDGILSYVTNSIVHPSASFFVVSEKFAIRTAIIVLSEINGYDPENVFNWIKVKSSLNLNNDGIALSPALKIVTEDDPLFTDKVIEFKLDLVNGLKTYTPTLVTNPAGSTPSSKWDSFTTRYKNKMDGYNSNPELGLNAIYEVQIAGNDLTVRAVSKSTPVKTATLKFNYDNGILNYDTTSISLPAESFEVASEKFAIREAIIVLSEINSYKAEDVLNWIKVKGSLNLNNDGIALSPLSVVTKEDDPSFKDNVTEFKLDLVNGLKTYNPPVVSNPAGSTPDPSGEPTEETVSNPGTGIVSYGLCFASIAAFAAFVYMKSRNLSKFPQA